MNNDPGLSATCCHLCVFRLIRHTEKLLEEKQEKLCIQVLETLKKMMKLENDYGDKVSAFSFEMITVLDVPLRSDSRL